MTTAHLATNPRLVKEADALAAAGYAVTVVACRYIPWAAAADDSIRSRAGWKLRVLSWLPRENPALFWRSRLRQHVCRRFLQCTPQTARSTLFAPFALRAADRVLPELRRRALKVPADLYIAHNLGALPAAAAAARVHGARLGFDAEDFHSGMRRYAEKPTVDDHIAEFFECRYLTRCDYMTAASPDIADAYAERYAIARPTPVLNVFPLTQRSGTPPAKRREGPLTLYWFSQTIGAHRGLEDAVRAMGELSSILVELHLRGQWQAGYRKELEELARQVGVDPAHIVAHEAAPPGDMVRLSAQYDIGLALEENTSPNRNLCLTNKLFVYLLAGNAIIATATRAQSALVAEIGDAGACYEAGDIHSLAGHLRRWATDRGALDHARRQAWEAAGHSYNWDREQEKFLSLVDRTLDAAPCGS